MPPSTTALRTFLLAAGLASAALASAAPGAGAGAGAGTGRARLLRRGGGDPRRLRGAAAGRALGYNSANPLHCVLRGKLDADDSLGMGEAVCAGNTELEMYEFGLTKGGEIILWHHNYRTGVETVVWKDPSGIAGHHLSFTADGAAVLYDDKNAPLCDLGAPIPGLQNPKLVVNVGGIVSVRSATTGSENLWTLDPATSSCQRRTRSLGYNSANPLHCILRGKLDADDSLGMGQAVCAGNTELEMYEFGLTKGGEIILWHHDYRTGVETVVWKDPSGIAGHHLSFTADGATVLYDDKNAPLCDLGAPVPGLQNPKLVVNVGGAVSVRSATTGSDNLWTLDPATSSCQRRRSLGFTAANPLHCVLRNKLDVGDSLAKKDAVCAGNTELEMYEFGLTPNGEIILWHHDYRTGIETVVWQDPSGLAGDAMELEADGTVVLYDEGVQLCALGEPVAGLQNPKLVVSIEGVVSVKSATSGSTSVWTLDAAASACQ
jgi:hypothetical protein